MNLKLLNPKYYPAWRRSNAILNDFSWWTH